MLGGHRGRGVRKKAERKATKIVIEKCHHETQFIINKKKLLSPRLQNTWKTFSGIDQRAGKGL